jgi:CHAD domain-containing protein
VTRLGKVPRLGADTPLHEAADELLHARFADFCAAQTRVVRRMDVKSVHDLRVACRRLRAAVKLFGKKPLRAQDVPLEHLQDVLGAVRDLQLRIRWMKRHRAPVARLEARLRRAEARLRVTLAQWTGRAAPRLLRALPHVHSRGTLGGRRTRKRLRRRVRKLEAALAGAKDLQPRAAHALRIAAKKLRYDAELLRDAFDLEETIDVLSEIQSALGDVHDADLLLETVRGLPRLERAALARRRRRAAAAQRVMRRAKKLCSALQRQGL